MDQESRKKKDHKKDQGRKEIIKEDQKGKKDQWIRKVEKKRSLKKDGKRPRRING